MLAPRRTRDRVAQRRQPFSKMIRLPGLARAKMNLRMQRILENVHPESAVSRVIVERVEQDDVLGQGAGAIVALNGGRERRQIRINYDGVRNLIEPPRWTSSGEIVRPEHVIFARRHY